MKKYFYLAAVSAMMLTACSSEKDVLEPKTGPAKQEVTQQAVGFDVYLPTATAGTRSGRAGVMTTGIMKETGFGVYAYQNDGTDTDNKFTSLYSYSVGPNFMWNQQVSWNGTASGWYYSPLKYWPNETYKDSQNPAAVMPEIPASGTTQNVDQLSFFAYAPWVKAASNGTPSVVNANLEAPQSPTAYGITAIGANNDTGNDPKITYKMAIDPDYSVDLLWGVAPVGGLSYTNVSGSTTSVAEGMPLVGLVKPAVNTSLKFLFQHSLARIGVKVVAAVDQVAAGGVFDYGNSKITIEEIRIMGPFGTAGTLNLNNTSANVPRWDGVTLANTAESALKIAKDKGLAPHLIYDPDKNKAGGYAQQVVTGVTTSPADAIKVRSLYDADYKDDCSTKEATPAYSATRPFFASADNSAANVAYDWTKDDAIYLQLYTTNNGNAFKDITGIINTLYPKATVWENIYKIDKNAILKVVESSPTTGQVAINGVTGYKAYRKMGTTNPTYVATNQPVQIGDFVFQVSSADATPTIPDDALAAPTTATPYWKAKPNYFMVIPPTYAAPQSVPDRTLKVKITYYVSTEDPNLEKGIVYTKNEVEKEVVLPVFRNGKAYDLKLILGLTSVKLEAEVSDWTTTNVQVDLPQNTAE